MPRDLRYTELIPIRISVDSKTLLAAFAERRNITVSELIRELIQDYLDEQMSE